MKGKLHKTEQGWVVSCFAEQSGDNIWVNTFPLHPKDILDVEQYVEATKITHEVEANMEVEFEMVTETYEDGKGCPYAKLLPHSVESNEMIDHIGEVNEMVEDDVEKLAEEEFSDNQLKDMYSYEDAIRFRGKLSYARKGFVKGYNKAKETLYTEEQVKELLYYYDLEIKKHLLNYPIDHSLHSKMCDGINDVRNNYIQSLKQPK
jgi:hypothetical protein